jgi:Major Facilitator Superfamily
LVNLPVGVAALAITRWRVDESKTPNAARPDWAGFATLTAGLVSLVYGLIRAGEIAWSDSGVVICLVLAVVFLGLFVVVELRAQNPLFDLTLFRISTFRGGLIAAFAMNGSLYAMLLYLVLYLQDDLGYSALGTGLRLLVMSGVTLVTATIAGRLSTHMPIRWLIGPGLFLVGVGLLLMTGLNGASSWTHLIPGFIVAGAGSGMVNPPLASTAVGVVTPQRSGMASGVNTTFRQIGIATGIAAYGSIFASSLQSKLGQTLAGTPALHQQLPRIVAAVQQGDAAQAFDSVPQSLRGPLSAAIHSSFASTLDVLLVVSACLALVGAACSLGFIRSRDFVASQQPQSPQMPTEQVSAPAKAQPA